MTSDNLCLSDIYANLQPHAADCSLYLHKSVTSTNTLARELASSGAKHATTIIADEQTAGKGRMGRAFYSPGGSGLYMSIILRPNEILASSLELLTVLAAVAVCEAIEELSPLTPQVKWVNDIVLSERKVGGISCETRIDPLCEERSWVILGIGINVSTKEEVFPIELRSLVSSLYPGHDCPFTRSQLAAAIIKSVLHPKAESTAALVASYRRRLMMLERRIEVYSSSERYEAVAKDVDAAGHLLVQKDSGELCVLMAGEISIKIVGEPK